MIQIGILANRYKSTFGVTTPYLEFVGKFGRPYLILPPAHMLGGDQHSLDTEFNTILYSIDMLVLPGGGDIRARAYEGVPGWYQTHGNPWFDFFDEVFLPRFIRAEIPIFGICRGMQALNVATGGTLHSHMPTHPYSEHDRGKLVHKVRPLEGEEFEVNSLHHQAISTLGGGFEVVAHSEDNLIEAIVNRDFPLAGVQWHPEEIFDLYSLTLMGELADRVDG